MLATTRQSVSNVMHRWSGRKTVTSVISHAQIYRHRVNKHVELKRRCTYLIVIKHARERASFCQSSKPRTLGQPTGTKMISQVDVDI